MIDLYTFAIKNKALSNYVKKQTKKQSKDWAK